ncbi:unnamed protein product [Ambrosiozyma monospora]|uniref:Unnamed protein product n=1 Tax=Ambrosiozyma monospora TaxID=43982 RepID=A0ACB5T2H8_AMBMO|nr:unnamed protein product [Ambrosiozyma monospora]
MDEFNKVMDALPSEIQCQVMVCSTDTSNFHDHHTLFEDAIQMSSLYDVKYLVKISSGEKEFQKSSGNKRFMCISQYNYDRYFLFLLAIGQSNLLKRLTVENRAPFAYKLIPALEVAEQIKLISDCEDDILSLPRNFHSKVVSVVLDPEPDWRKNASLENIPGVPAVSIKRALGSLHRFENLRSVKFKVLDDWKEYSTSDRNVIVMMLVNLSHRIMRVELIFGSNHAYSLVSMCFLSLNLDRVVTIRALPEEDDEEVDDVTPKSNAKYIQTSVGSARQGPYNSRPNSSSISLIFKPLMTLQSNSPMHLSPLKRSLHWKCVLVACFVILSYIITGTIYTPKTSELIPTIHDPNAPNPNELAKGYYIKKINEDQPNRLFSATLELIGNATNVFGADFEELQFTLEYQTEHRLNVKIEPVDKSHVFILPDDVLEKPQFEIEQPLVHHDLEFSYEKNPFSFTVKRRKTNEVLFSTLGNPLIFSNQFIQFNTSLPQNHVISGLGESYHGYVNEPGTVRTFYASDKSTVPEANTYGTHPVYYDERVTGSHAVYWRTSSIQEVLIEDKSLTWRSLSGIIDLYFYSGPTIHDAISQFVTSIGTPALPPYWALGYHQSRWGYGTVGELNEIPRS